MARRRKKSKKPPSAGIAPKVDKSLPALPPSAAQPQAAFTPDLDTPSDVFSEPTTTDASPRPPQSRRNESSPANFRRDASPASLDDSRKGNVPLVTIPRVPMTNFATLQTTSHFPRAHTKRRITTTQRLPTRTTTAPYFRLHLIRTLPLAPLRLVNQGSLPRLQWKQTRAGWLRARLGEITSTGPLEVIGRCSRRIGRGRRPRRDNQRVRISRFKKRDGSSPTIWWTQFESAKSPLTSRHLLPMIDLAATMLRLLHRNQPKRSSCRMYQRTKRRKQGRTQNQIYGRLRTALSTQTRLGD